MNLIDYIDTKLSKKDLKRWVVIVNAHDNQLLIKSGKDKLFKAVRVRKWKRKPEFLDPLSQYTARLFVDEVKTMALALGVPVGTWTCKSYYVAIGNLTKFK